MQNAITTLRIQNFKSIKDVTIQPRRVNIIIGEPNVGKSNILEALSLLGGMVYDKGGRFMEGMIRYEQPEQLFYDSVVVNTVSIETERDKCFIYSDPYYLRPKAVFINNAGIAYFKEKDTHYGQHSGMSVAKLLEAVAGGQKNHDDLEWRRAAFGWVDIDASGNSSQSNRRPFERSTDDILQVVRVRPYSFSKQAEVGKRDAIPYLLPPHGTNLKNVIQARDGLRQEAARFFKPYGLKMLLRMASNEIEIAKEVGELMYTYPYSSIADTLQRLIFHLAAIESNDDAVLLFEEPEAHSYPVYVSRLARRIVESRNNQFFVVTHSPYFITEVLEEMLTNDELTPELAVFVAYYEDYQTKVRQLGDDEVYNIRRDGLDVFYNMARFVPES